MTATPDLNANQVTTEKHGDTTRVRLAGEVDLAWSQQIRRAVLAALEDSRNVGVDLAAVSYIDSSGIAALVEGFQIARSRGTRFVLVAVSEPVRAVLELSRLDRVFTLVDTLADGA